MFLSWVAGFALAAAEKDESTLYWIIAFSALPLKLRLKAVEGLAVWFLEFAVLAGIFYSVSAWYARWRATRRPAA
jgi:hypothetical protein